MEGKDDCKDWDWQEEDFRLDAESPLAISHSLWSDLTHSAADVRSLFTSTPASESSELVLDHQDSGEPCSPTGKMCGDSPRLKRRRMLLFSGEETEINTCSLPLDSMPERMESCSDCFLEGCDDLRLQELTPTSSLWYMANDESLSSMDESAEQCAESWMARCLNDRDAQACLREMGVEMPASEASAGTPECGGDAARGSPVSLRSRAAVDGRNPAPILSRRKLATPVAYPFAVVKPSGVQGDVTLNDINQRILMPPSRPLHHVPHTGDDSRQLTTAAGSSAISGKSVVALTKIHTEGNGTITIVRTKN